MYICGRCLYCIVTDILCSPPAGATECTTHCYVVASEFCAGDFRKRSRNVLGTLKKCRHWWHNYLYFTCHIAAMLFKLKLWPCTTPCDIKIKPTSKHVKHPMYSSIFSKEHHSFCVCTFQKSNTIVVVFCCCFLFDSYTSFLTR